MSSIHNRAVGGYYPFGAAHIPAVLSMFKAPYKGSRILDPCAGEGAALGHISESLNLTAFANEIDHDRAQTCIERFGITNAVQGDIKSLRMPHDAVQIMWLNPPYMTDMAKGAAEKRREFDFLKHSWKWLQDSGYMAWVVYAHHINDVAARFLVQNTTNLTIYRVPGMHLDNYVQVVVVGQKVSNLNLGAEQIQQAMSSLLSATSNPDELTELKEVEKPIYTIPAPKTLPRFYFHADEISMGQAHQFVNQFGAHHLPRWNEIHTPEPPAPEMTPIVPPRGGQLGLILAAGVFNGLVVNLPTGRAAIRGVVRMETVNTTPEGREGERETYETKARVTITTVDKQGQIEIIKSGDHAQMLAFIKRHKQSFLDYLEEHAQPIYDFNHSELRDVFARVFRNRLLPGRPVTGLFETQKHVVAALYATLMRRRSVICVGDMGVGKSVMGSTLIGALHTKGHFEPDQIAVIMCPPHLVHKWAREFVDAVPGSVTQVLEKVDDTVAFMDKAAQQSDVLHVAVISRERAKLGEGWEPAYVMRKRHQVQWPKDAPTPKHLCKPGTNEPKKGVTRLATNKVPACPCCGEFISSTADGKKFPVSKAWLGRQRRKCHNCGKPLWQLKRTFSKPKGGKKFPEKNPRYPLADLLAQRYSDRIAVTAFDELHELKGGSSDQGRAMQTLANISDRIVGLTGTLFGGVASSVFWLEWAFNPRMYEHYTIELGRESAIRTWVQTMGVLEKVIEYKEERTESGRYSGVKRIEHLPKEIPGISPLLIRELIDHCVWVGLPDMAFALPQYEEIPIPVSLDGDVQARYDECVAKMIDYLMACRMVGDASFLGTYLQTALRWPSACFRDKPVIHRLTKKGINPETGEYDQVLVFDLKGFEADRIYPKEAKLLELLKQELSQNRPCVVFVEQTGTQDIQPRLTELIEMRVPNAKPAILRSNTVKTDQREEWLEKQIESGVNVLVCNPKLVQTGLDLLAFKSLIFYEIAYNLYVTSQASRRHWRIGQTDTCKVFYLFYQDTMEARAIGLVSAKKSAASLLGGDADGGGLAQLGGGSSSLEAALAEEIANDKKVIDVSTLFQQTAQQSADFTSGWAEEGQTIEVEAQVIPLENLIGSRFLYNGRPHLVIDYGPLDEAVYIVRNLIESIETSMDAETVKKAVQFKPLPANVPVATLIASTKAKAARVEKQKTSAKKKAFAAPANKKAPTVPAKKKPSVTPAERHQMMKKTISAPSKRALLFVERSGILEIYGEDAVAVAKILNSQIQTSPADKQVWYGISSTNAANQIKQLVEAGYHVQVAMPKGKKAPESEDLKPTSISELESLPLTTKDVEEEHRLPSSPIAAHKAYLSRKAQTKRKKEITLIEMPEQYITFSDDAQLVAKHLEAELVEESAVTYAVISRTGYAGPIESLRQAGHRVSLVNGSVETFEAVKGKKTTEAAKEKKPLQPSLFGEGLDEAAA